MLVIFEFPKRSFRTTTNQGGNHDQGRGTASSRGPAQGKGLSLPPGIRVLPGCRWSGRQLPRGQWGGYPSYQGSSPSGVWPWLGRTAGLKLKGALQLQGAFSIDLLVVSEKQRCFSYRTLLPLYLGYRS